MLTGLGTAVTPVGVAAVLDVDHHDIRLDVVAYRPTERAVVRITTTTGDVLAYLKVVAPDETASIAARHDALVAAGVPAPTGHGVRRRAWVSSCWNPSSDRRCGS